MRQILHEMKRNFQARNKALVSEGVLRKPIDFLFDLTYNSQMQRTTVSIQHKDGAPTVERDGSMQLDVMVTFSKQLTSLLGFRKVCVKVFEIYVTSTVLVLKFYIN